MKKVVMYLMLFVTFGAEAGIADCTDLYVGKITLRKTGSVNVVFLADPANLSGSYSTNLAGWTDDNKKYVLSVLSSAKMAQHRVYFETEAADGCSINTAGQTLSLVSINNNP